MHITIGNRLVKCGIREKLGSENWHLVDKIGYTIRVPDLCDELHLWRSLWILLWEHQVCLEIPALTGHESRMNNTTN